MDNKPLGFVAYFKWLFTKNAPSMEDFHMLDEEPKKSDDPKEQNSAPSMDPGVFREYMLWSEPTQ